MQVSVVKEVAEDSCSPSEHRFFALEMIGIEDPPRSVSPVVCTQCGTMLVFKITL